MTEIGIWIDSEKAKILTIKEEFETFNEILSEVEHLNVRGGSGSSTPYGPQDAISESKFLERKNHQLKAFFNEVKSSLNGNGPIVVYGPAETKVSFKKDLEDDSAFKDRLSAIHSADSMTDGQFKALVREYFKKD